MDDGLIGGNVWPISIPKGDGNGTSGRQNLCCNHWYSFLLRGGSRESHHLLFLRNDKVYVYYVKTQHPVHRTFHSVSDASIQ